jgi:hypothetical protein
MTWDKPHQVMERIEELCDETTKDGEAWVILVEVEFDHEPKTDVVRWELRIEEP